MAQANRIWKRYVGFNIYGNEIVFSLVTHVFMQNDRELQNSMSMFSMTTTNHIMTNTTDSDQQLNNTQGKNCQK